jgi:polyisoprenoid-binding protein YceI
MKSLALVTGILALAAPFGVAQTSTWVSDPMHSEVDFTITHMAISNVHGRFGHVNATIMLDSADMSKSTVKATIDVAGVDTGEDKRNAHLKSPDFFDVATDPSATFVSTSVAKSGDGLTVNGNLTLHGVLTVEGPRGPAQGMDKKEHSGFSATTTIKRTDFGIGPKFPAAVVGDEVKLNIELDVAKQ